MNDLAIGYLCCLVSCLGFGSNYIPVKKVDVRDGWFFTLWLTVGIFLVAVVQWLVFGLYKFEPFAMLGGLIWATGNLFVPLIITRCGLGVGQLVWGCTNMLIGWATGTFGLFGKNVDTVSKPAMNYFGVALSVFSLVLFAGMEQPKPEDQVQAREAGISLNASEGNASPENPSPENPALLESPYGAPSTDTRTEARRFFVGFVIALMAGVLFGSNFDPPTYLQQQGQADVANGLPPRHSPNPMDYVIAHFTGILLSTMCYFAVAVAVKRDQYLGREIILPAIGSGIFWGIAQVAWFKANGALSYVVSFPIIVGVPGLIASLWGVVLFGENRGKRNGSLLVLIILVQAAAVLLIALSKG